MKKFFIVFALFAMVLFLGTSCDSLWKVEAPTNVSFKIDFDTILDASGQSSMVNPIRSGDILPDFDDDDYDDLLVVVSLLNSSNDSEINSVELSIEESQDNVVIFDSLKAGQNVYAQIQIIETDDDDEKSLYFRARSINTELKKGVNILEARANAVFMKPGVDVVGNGFTPSSPVGSIEEAVRILGGASNFMTDATVFVEDKITLAASTTWDYPGLTIMNNSDNELIIVESSNSATPTEVTLKGITFRGNIGEVSEKSLIHLKSGFLSLEDITITGFTTSQDNNSGALLLEEGDTNVSFKGNVTIINNSADGKPANVVVTSGYSSHVSVMGELSESSRISLNFIESPVADTPIVINEGGTFGDDTFTVTDYRTGSVFDTEIRTEEDGSLFALFETGTIEFYLQDESGAAVPLSEMYLSDIRDSLTRDGFIWGTDGNAHIVTIPEEALNEDLETFEAFLLDYKTTIENEVGNLGFESVIANLEGDKLSVTFTPIIVTTVNVVFLNEDGTALNDSHFDIIKVGSGGLDDNYPAWVWENKTATIDESLWAGSTMSEYLDSAKEVMDNALPEYLIEGTLSGNTFTITVKDLIEINSADIDIDDITPDINATFGGTWTITDAMRVDGLTIVFGDAIPTYAELFDAIEEAMAFDNTTVTAEPMSLSPHVGLVQIGGLYTTITYTTNKGYIFDGSTTMHKTYLDITVLAKTGTIEFYELQSEGVSIALSDFDSSKAPYADELGNPHYEGDFPSLGYLSNIKNNSGISGEWGEGGTAHIVTIDTDFYTYEDRLESSLLNLGYIATVEADGDSNLKVNLIYEGYIEFLDSDGNPLYLDPFAKAGMTSSVPGEWKEETGREHIFTITGQDVIDYNDKILDGSSGLSSDAVNTAKRAKLTEWQLESFLSIWVQSNLNTTFSNYGISANVTQTGNIITVQMLPIIETSDISDSDIKPTTIDGATFTGTWAIENAALPASENATITVREGTTYDDIKNAIQAEISIPNVTISSSSTRYTIPSGATGEITTEGAARLRVVVYAADGYVIEGGYIEIFLDFEIIVEPPQPDVIEFYAADGETPLTGLTLEMAKAVFSLTDLGIVWENANPHIGKITEAVASKTGSSSVEEMLNSYNTTAPQFATVDTTSYFGFNVTTSTPTLVGTNLKIAFAYDESVHMGGIQFVFAESNQLLAHEDVRSLFEPITNINLQAISANPLFVAETTVTDIVTTTPPVTTIDDFLNYFANDVATSLGAISTRDGDLLTLSIPNIETGLIRFLDESGNLLNNNLGDIVHDLVLSVDGAHLPDTTGQSSMVAINSINVKGIGDFTGSTVSEFLTYFQSTYLSILDATVVKTGTQLDVTLPSYVSDEGAIGLYEEDEVTPLSNYDIQSVIGLSYSTLAEAHYQDPDWAENFRRVNFYDVRKHGFDSLDAYFSHHDTIFKDLVAGTTSVKNANTLTVSVPKFSGLMFQGEYDSQLQGNTILTEAELSEVKSRITGANITWGTGVYSNMAIILGDYGSSEPTTTDTTYVTPIMNNPGTYGFSSARSSDRRGYIYILTVTPTP